MSKEARLEAAALAQARRPTFSGTETTAWSAPTWAEYVRFLHEGQEGPGSVRQAPTALKRRIAAHSLLGDPEASNLRDLTMFPVVNPENGNLNENALRAVIGGRGSQADISERARASAQDMARRLLNAEYGADLEASKMGRETKEGAAGGQNRAAAESENLHNWLRDALEDVESGFDFLFVESFDNEAGTVVYTVRDEDGGVGTFRRSYSVDGEEVTVGEEREEVRRRVVYEEVPAEEQESRATGARMALPPMLVKALEAMGFQAARGPDGHSDVEIREAMQRALRAAVPAFFDVAEIFPDTRTVIYATRPENDLLFWRQTFVLDDGDGAVSLNEDAVQVEVEQAWKPVQARLQFEAAEGEGATSQPSGESVDDGEGQPAPNQPNDEGDTMSKTTNAKVDELVGRLIAMEAAPFDDSDKEHLSALGEEKLTALEERFQAPAAAGGEGEGAEGASAAGEGEGGGSEGGEGSAEGEAAAEGAETKAARKGGEEKGAETVGIEVEELQELRAAAAAWRASEKARQARQAEQKAGLVASLRAAQEIFDEKELKALSLEVLQKLARTHDLDAPAASEQPDYSGRALATPPTANRKASLPDPLGLGDAYYTSH